MSTLCFEVRCLTNILDADLQQSTHSAPLPPVPHPNLLPHLFSLGSGETACSAAQVGLAMKPDRIAINLMRGIWKDRMGGIQTTALPQAATMQQTSSQANNRHHWLANFASGEGKKPTDWAGLGGWGRHSTSRADYVAP